jgi:hypothetical protein
MILIVAALLVVGAILFTLVVRSKDLPEPAPVSPVQHLEERKARIYEGLRDLQFEYRVGKLSDADYQQTKLDLQGELARIMAEIDGILQKAPKAAAAVAPVSPAPAPAQSAPANVCPHCGATFGQSLKFCGECGKPMRKETA